MGKRAVILALIVFTFAFAFWRTEKVNACSARPLVLQDCAGFSPLRPKNQDIVDYLEKNDPELFNGMIQQLLHGEAVCGWIK